MANSLFGRLLLLAAILASSPSCDGLHVPSSGPDGRISMDNQPPNPDNVDVSTVIQTDRDDEAVDDDGQCWLSVVNRSASYFAQTITTWDINLVRFKFSFPPGINILPPSQKAIEAKHWIWTYSAAGGLFPYLKWPPDFHILSLSLLDGKSFRQTHIAKQTPILYIEAKGNCTIQLGTTNTTNKIALALRDVTQNYLIPLGKEYETFYERSYWCYLQETDNINITFAYKIGLYFPFPVQFAKYKCCRTWIPAGKTKLSVACSKPIEELVQSSIIPYIIGILLSAYFPIFLFRFSASMHSQKRHGYHSFDAISKNKPMDDWIFLDGTSPISFQTASSRLCGLADRFPVLTSRLRRTLFIILAPCVVYIQLHVYWKYMHHTTLSFLKHKNPLGYLSLLAGIKESRDTFVPMLGGPVCLLVVFYVASFLFVLLPAHTDRISHYGTGNASTDRPASPLFYNIETIERLASISITRTHGYGRVSSFCTAGIYMLANCEFWTLSISLQAGRMKSLFNFCQFYISRWFALTVSAVLLPIHICLCCAELIFCVVYFGFPMVTVVCILVKGYTMYVMDKVRDRINYVSRIVICAFSMCLLILYIYSFMTVYISSFWFLSKILVFCLIALIVHPAYSFGYLFFGCVFIYYIFNLIKGCGERYYELLTDAIEICKDLKPKFHLPQSHPKADVSYSPDDSTINPTENDDRSRKGDHGLIIDRFNMLGLRKDVFDYIVKKHRPVHKEIFNASVQLFLIFALIALSMSIILKDPFGPSEGAAEVMHVIFVVTIGALPKVAEMIFGRGNKATERATHLQNLKTAIMGFVSDKEEEDTVLVIINHEDETA